MGWREENSCGFERGKVPARPSESVYGAMAPLLPACLRVIILSRWADCGVKRWKRVIEETGRKGVEKGGPGWEG